MLYLRQLKMRPLRFLSRMQKETSRDDDQEIQNLLQRKRVFNMGADSRRLDEDLKKTTTQLTSMTRPMSVEETRIWLERLEKAKACKEIPEVAKDFLKKCKGESSETNRDAD